MKPTACRIGFRASLIVLIMTAGLAWPAVGQDTNDEQSVGKTIGTVIQDVISTALPSVRQLLDMFWPKDDPDKIDREELTSGIARAKSELEANVKSKIRPASAISQELILTAAYLDDAVSAHEAVLQMLGGMRSTANSVPNWPRLQEDWSAAEAYLSDIKAKTPDPNITGIRSAYVRLRLSNIVDAKNDYSGRITVGIENRDRVSVEANLLKLEGTLADMTAVVGFQIRDVGVAFQELERWATGSAAALPLSERDPFRDRLDRKYGSFEKLNE